MSYITMESTEVAKMAKECIAHILEKRKEMREYLIDRYHTKQLEKCSTWWGRLLRKKPLSKIEIRTNLERGGDEEGGDGTFEPYHRVDIYASMQLLRAEELLAAAKRSEKMRISVDDFNKIKGF